MPDGGAAVSEFTVTLRVWKERNSDPMGNLAHFLCRYFRLRRPTSECVVYDDHRSIFGCCSTDVSELCQVHLLGRDDEDMESGLGKRFDAHEAPGDGPLVVLFG